MTDIIYALEIVKRRIERLNGFGEEAEVIDNAISLLKAQQPRVQKLDEIKDGESYWLSAGKEFVTRPVICVHREDDARKPYITFVWQFGTFSWESEEYGKTWRVWSARPTDAERKAVKWDE